ncbi:MAG: flagellar biosynthesis protein FliQ [Planctomycetales bacterium]|nr:flagellar biosynthesis protein FliQ [Planctomycetales bacterium]
MNADELVQVGRELLITAILVSAPAIAVSLVVGLGISIFQALTSIQEQTLNFAPRILAVSVALIITLPWTVQVLRNFTFRMFELAASVGPT